MARPTTRRAGRTRPSPRWIVLIHQLPPSPAYLRVKVRRRLHSIGAFALKQTVYVLPNSDEALEDFQWLRQEIEAAGGTAVIAAADFLEGIDNGDVAAGVARARPAAASHAESEPDSVRPGRTWVTRKSVFVDRIASAWLIRRFIDRKAKFKFVASRGYAPRRGELRFDMTPAEYTHAGADCTFQTLVRRFALDDGALVALGEIVHDIDCKDDAFGRPETTGVAGLMRGVVVEHASDRDRLARGAAILDDLYAHFARG